MAKVVRFYEAGGPDVLRVEELPVGNPKDGEVRIRHLAVGMNFADTYFRQGYYPVPLPNGMGVEASRATNIRDFESQYESAIRHKGPRLIEVVL